MNDKEILKNVEDISKWLDSIIVEINSINETLEDLLADAPAVVKEMRP